MTGYQYQMGRIGGIPIMIDVTFLVLAILWGHHFFTAGNLNGFLTGFWIVGGVTLSILLHELAHACAGRRYGVKSTQIELNGLGGLCYFDRIAPSAKADIVISLAGPATNLALWAILKGINWGITSSLALSDDDLGLLRFAYVAHTLAVTNFIMFWFNLLPSHPLDGGKALSRLLGMKFGYDLAQRIVAMTGMAVCAYLALISLGVGVFTMVIAYDLYLHNQAALDTHKGTSWRRKG
jgi:Zn-dependent protease